MPPASATAAAPPQEQQRWPSPQQHWGKQQQQAAALLAALVAVGGGWAAPPAGHAAIPIGAPGAQEQRAKAYTQLGGRYPVRSAPEPGSEPEGSRVLRALALLQDGAAAAGAEDYPSALAAYETVAAQFPDFALAERARTQRGLLLYQLGRAAEAILQLEDEEVALRGAAEVHAALAVVLYAERPEQIARVEQQWEVASEFDRRYSNPDWVRSERGWPPAMIGALRRFLTLQ